MTQKNITKRELIENIKLLQKRIAKLQVMDIRRKQAEQALKESETRYKAIYETSKDAIMLLTPEEGFSAGNTSAIKMFECRDEKEFISHSPDDLSPEYQPDGKMSSIKAREMMAAAMKKSFHYFEWKHRTIKGRDFLATVLLTRLKLQNKKLLQATVRDITELKQIEIYREIENEILQILNEPGDMPYSIRRVLAVLKAQTEVDAVGIRLQDGDDFPYFLQNGFSEDFLLTENSLVERRPDGSICRNSEGRVSLECTCGLVISGKTDPANPLFTRGGSCWTNDSFPLLDLPESDDPRYRPRNECIHNGYASVALVPIRTSTGIVGLIQLNGKAKGLFSLSSIHLLEVIAAHIGEALMRKQAEKKISYISFHDSLTGLYNRRYMEEEMQRLDTQRQLPVSIIMADVNGLKKVNDTYGHRAGDELLGKAAGILRESCRKEDIIARWGGDEFLVLLPQTCAKTAASICRRIHNVCAKAFVKNVAVSIALGFAEKNNSERNLAEVIKDADGAMYKDKIGKG